ncbi:MULTISPECIES: PqqD family peptide modification chaperone [Streptococcus]|uniref:PqqD family peptide modification chaperone n=1 Tax=Streptococcus TaxID=1301 RepID=UPI001E545D14|nr:PqqD family peptide modification chaperone [Streptococcus pseudopneumoniae]MCE2619446.1 ATP-binding cassette domain-containing protein [Streptococcus pseudopneumoniae]
MGVLGENGAGKTTLIKMMTTLLKQDSGEITINGIDINDNLKDTRSKINVISDGERNLFIWSKIDTSISYDHLLRKLTSEYDVSEKKADKDLKRIINQFSELEFVSVNTLRKSNSNRVSVALPYSSTACG